MLLLHLDFKGVLPRPAHLPRLLQDIKSLGYDGIVVEYEDVFPFAAVDAAWRPRERWSRRTLNRFLTEAARLGLEVIPLQQTLGHLEWLFRWQRYAGYALGGKYPSTVDITNPQAVELVRQLLREVLAAHPGARYAHIGMDEAHALVVYARENGLNVVNVFLDYMETICAVCEEFGVKPVIWPDMLEDNFSSEALPRFRALRDRVVLCEWGYEERGPRETWARCNGMRAARAWRERPLDQNAPPLTPASKTVEDLDRASRALIKPYYDGETFQPLFWADVWKKSGFEVWGASAARTSGDYAILPLYNDRVANVRTWAEARRRTGAEAQLVTSWARGTTFCPPIYPFDASWYVLQEAARAEGKAAPGKEFFAGIKPKTVTRIFQTLGRCRQDWRLENEVADEMFALAPQLKQHRYEWETVAWLARLLHWSRRLEAAHSEVTYFACNDRLPAYEFQRRLEDQAAILKDGRALRRTLRAHFAERYHGDAFEEWLRDVFDVPMALLHADTPLCRHKKTAAQTHYR
jgi:hypothetical protein